MEHQPTRGTESEVPEAIGVQANNRHSEGDIGAILDWFRWFQGLVIGLGFFFLALFVMRRSPASLIIGGGLLGLLFPAARLGASLIRRGRMGLGLACGSVGIWLAAIGISTRGTITLALAVSTTFLPVIIAIPYLPRHKLRWIALGSFSAAAICGATAAAGPLISSTLSDQALAIIAVPILLVLVGMALFALWHVSSRLSESLSETQTMNLALRESERLLEQKVEKRTSELGRKNEELELALAEVSDIDEIARTANATLDVSRVVEVALGAVQKIFPSDMTALGLLDERREVLILGSPRGAGWSPEVLEQVSKFRIPLSEQSAFAHVVKNGRPFYIREIGPQAVAAMSDADRTLFGLIGARSLLILPLEVEGEPVGMIVFANTLESVDLERRDIDRIQPYITPLAASIRNAQLFEEANRALNEISDTQEIARTANATLDIKQVLQVALAAQKVFPCDGMGIGLLDEERAELVMQRPMGSGMNPEARVHLTELRIPMEEESSAFIHVVQNNRPFFLVGVQPEQVADMSPSDRRLYDAYEPRSILICPLEVEGAVVGVTLLVNNHEDLDLERSEIDRIQRYLTPLSTAIRNARLFEETQVALAEARDLHEIAREMITTLDLDRVATLVMETLQKVFHFDQLGIAYFDDGRQNLVLEQVVGAGFDEVRDRLLGTTMPGDEHESGFIHVVETRKPIFVPNIDPAVPMSPTDRFFFEANPPKGLLICPLEVEDQAIGVIYFGNTQQPLELDEAGIAATRRYITLLSTAIRNARLFEEVKQARAAAIEANQAKSQFLANMSHELRTPLTAIIGYAEMLQEDAGDQLGEYSEDLEQILSSSGYLLELISGVLDLSKIEAGKMEVYLERCEVANLVNGVAETVQPLIQQRSNRLVLGNLEGLESMLTDVTKVRQALLNLLSNASKFTEGGEIRLEAERTVQNFSDWLVFRVIDSGIGMTEKQCSRIFEAFAQADASTTKRYGGTGLGLPIAKQFCEMLGGSIEVESTEGIGTTFTVHLPTETQLGRSAREIPEALGSTASGLRVKCALVVDDDPATRDLIGRALAQQGFGVITASGGREALQMARGRRPDLITLDVVMPDMDGWTVLGEIKADPELAETPVIMLSIEENQRRGYALGASEYLMKPIDKDRLATVLKTYGGHGQALRALVVDDDPSIREMLRRGLQRAGWSTATAENGLVGLERVAEAAPDLVLLDLMMPEMDGFEFLEELRGREAWRDIPVVVMTGKDLTAEDRERLNGAVTRILEKGAGPAEDLLEKVRSLISASTPPTMRD